MTTILRQTLEKPVQGFWDGGPKQVFDWSVSPLGSMLNDVRVGSYTANMFFTVRRGKSLKLTLSYAKRHLKAITRIPSMFEYVEVATI